MADHTTIIHLVAGGVGGTSGAVLTCPLEVVKTRLQSSIATFQRPVILTPVGSYAQPASQHVANLCTCINTSSSYSTISRHPPRLSILQCLRYIVQNEGALALFKGLGPNLVGVAPSRAIYFCAYASAKRFCNSHLKPETPLVHICSASFAGFSACTLTNPIWYVKTMLQLDQKEMGTGRYTVKQCLRDTYQKYGVRGFYKGITASYAGISETVIHFVIYEAIKRKLMERKEVCHCNERTPKDFLEFMFAGAVSKTVASSIAYPHEVVRTRLREPGDKFRGFFQTLGLVAREEGMAGLYRGLATQLVRQIPNTAIMMSTYEAVVYLLSQEFG